MSCLRKLQEIKEKHKVEAQESGHIFIPFEKRNMAIQIWSEVLGCEVWLCSNEAMVQQLRKDDPSSVCYTASELNELCEKRISSKQLEIIHHAKKKFNPSRVIKTEKD